MVVACTQCLKYIHLVHFDHAGGRFLGGDYSAKYGNFLPIDILVSRFLVEHAGTNHLLQVAWNGFDAYAAIRERMTPWVPEELTRPPQPTPTEPNMNHYYVLFGQYQLAQVRIHLESQIRQLQRMASTDAAHAQFLLGQQAALEEAVQYVHELESWNDQVFGEHKA